jgi:hypothetical protein
MAETQRQEDATREAARYQEEQAIAQEEQRWNRAWAMLEAGVPTAEVYATLGVEPGTKTFEQIMAEKAAELDARKVALSRSGGGGGGSGYSDSPYYTETQGERANVMTGGLLERADAQYELNRQREGNAGNYPLYYTLNTLFNNSDWRKAITSSGADVKTVADYLVTKYAGTTPEQYFQTGKAAGTSVAAAYKQLLNQSERDSY